MVQKVPQGARLNKGPGCSRFGTKVAVHWEGLVVFIHNIVDSSACGILQHHDIFTRSRQSDLTLVSAKTLCACAPVSSLCDVTHSMTGAAVLARWHVTAFVVTGLIRTALARNTLGKKYYSWRVLKQQKAPALSFLYRNPDEKHLLLHICFALNQYL